MPVSGLRKGCSPSSLLFNICHQVVMRGTLASRNRDGRKERVTVWKWIPVVRLWNWGES